MNAPSPDAAALAELAEKYRALHGLRLRRDASDESATRATLRSLAERHPGCLRELDTLGADELERRARAAEAAAAGGPRAPWMDWICAYHRLLRAALTIKAGRAPVDEASLLASAETIAGFPLGPDFLREVAAPPEGRLAVLVLRRLSALFAVPAPELAATLFPVRRPSPYSLEDA